MLPRPMAEPARASMAVRLLAKFSLLLSILQYEVAYEYEYGKGNGAEKSMAMPTNPHWLSKGQNNNGWLKEVKKIPFQTFNRIR